MAALGSVGKRWFLDTHSPEAYARFTNVTNASDGVRLRTYANTSAGGVAAGSGFFLFGKSVISSVAGARERVGGWSRQVNGQTQINGVATNQPVTIMANGQPVRVYQSNPNLIVEDLPAGTYEVVVHGNGSKRTETWGPTSVSAPSRLELSGSLAACSSGVAYSDGLDASGGYGTKTWDITGSLPSGLSFSTSTGLITGTTSSTGTYKLTIGVSVPDGYRVFKNVTLTVA